MRSTIFKCGILLALGLLTSGCAPTRPQFAVQMPLLKAKIGNGLKLVVIPDEHSQMVQVDVRYEVGSNEDPKGRAGLAHLVEHMMFQQRFGKEGVPLSERHPTFEILPQLGVTGMNAYTKPDETHYWLQARKEDLSNLLQLEASRMSTGCKLIPEEQFEREREVVRNEIRMRTSSPMGQLYVEAHRAAYPVDHPYHEYTGGDDEQLTHITMQDVCTFMNNYYVPSRATVIVAGNVNYERVGKLVNGYFGHIQAKDPAPRMSIAPVTIKKHTVTMDFDLERTVVNVMWAMPPHYTDAYDNASFMQYALASIAGDLGKKYEVCDPSGVTEIGGKLAPVMMASFEVRPGKSVGDCLDFVWKAADMTPRYFEDLGSYDSERQQKSLRKQSFVEGIESLADRTEFIANEVQFDRRVDFSGDDNYFYKKLDRIDNLDSSRFKTYVQKTLSKSRALIFIARAKKEGKKGDTRAKKVFKGGADGEAATAVIDPLTANTPLRVPSSASILLQAERYTLGNGMRVVLLPFDGLPLVKARLIFRTGSVAESASKAGLANIAADLSLPSGASKVRAAGVSIVGDAGRDTTTFYGSGMNIYLDELIRGLERVVKVGSLSQRAIENYQKDYKDRFSRPSFQRQRVYSLELDEALYGKDHPYVTKGSPTPKTLAAIGIDAANGFGRKHYSAANATLVVVGNFEVERAKSIIADSLGDWSGGFKDQPIPLKARERNGPEYIGVLAKEGTPQMTITIAFPGPAGVDSKQAARLVLGEMLRLRMGTVRTQLGSSYGVSAGRSRSVGPNSYRIRGRVDAPRAGESLKFIRAKVQELRDGVDFNRDFVTARYNILKKLVAESTVTSVLATRLSMIDRFGVPPDFMDRLARDVGTVTPEQVKKIMSTELDPNKEIIVNMADRATLEAAFAEAGISGVRIVDPTNP